MNRNLKYMKNNLYNYGYNNNWCRVYNRLYTTGRALNCFSKVYNVNKILCGIKGICSFL